MSSYSGHPSSPNVTVVTVQLYGETQMGKLAIQRHAKALFTESTRTDDFIYLLQIILPV